MSEIEKKNNHIFQSNSSDEESNKIIGTLKKLNDIPQNLLLEIDETLSFQKNIIDDLKEVVRRYEKTESVNLNELEKTLKQFKTQDRIAEGLQSSIFPKKLPDNDLLSITVKLIPMNKTSGDFYDFAELISNNVYGLFISDIQGHGVSAALVSNLVKMLFISASEKFISPKKTMEYINNKTCDILQQRSFFTAFYAVIDFPNKQLLYSAGGHSYSIRYNFKEKKLEVLTTRDTLMGLMEEMEFEEKNTDFGIGDRIIIYTDGIPESMDKHGEQYGIEKFYELLLSNIEAPAEDLINLILQDVRKFMGTKKFQDDVTIAIIDIKSDKEKAGEVKEGKGYYSRDDIQRLIAYYKKSLQIKKEKKDKVGAAKDLIKLGRHLADRGEPDEALQYLKKAESIASKLGDENLTGEVNWTLNLAYSHIGDFDSALKYAKNSLDSYLRTHNKDGVSYVYNSLFVAYSRKGDNQKARQYLLKALKLNNSMKKTNDVYSRIASIYNNIGYTYYVESNIDKALTFYLKSYEIAENKNFVKLMGTLMNNIGDIYRQKAQYDKALEYFHKCLRILGDVDDKMLLLVILVNLSDIYNRKEDKDLSIYYLNKAVYVSQKYHLTDLESYTKTLRAYRYIRKNNTIKAINDLIDAIEINKKLGVDITQGFTKLVTAMILLTNNEIANNKLVKLMEFFPDADKNNTEWFFKQAVKDTSEPMNTDFYLPVLCEYAIFLHKNDEKEKSVNYLNKALGIANKFGNLSEEEAIYKKAENLGINFDLLNGE